MSLISYSSLAIAFSHFALRAHPTTGFAGGSPAISRGWLGSKIAICKSRFCTKFD